jgi:hypothetical protein
MESAEIMHGTNTHRVFKDVQSFVEVICLWNVNNAVVARYLAFGLMKKTNKPLNYDIWYSDKTLHWGAFT